MKIAFAIPTYNRIQYLRKCVESIKKQYLDNDLEIVVCISNSCSTDGTDQYLKDLSLDNGNFIAINNVSYQSDGTPVYVGKENWIRVFESVPVDVDWVWILGDDDWLISDYAVSQLNELIKNNNDPNITLIHACQARRSTKSNRVLKGNLFDLCNTIGYHEVLGWMSSILIRRKRLSEVIDTGIYQNSNSAYAHSAAILSTCLDDEAIFIDSCWVDPQDEVQTEESIDRWKKDDMAEKYFYVIDDLLDLYKSKRLTKLCKPVFFRYLTYSLWDRLAINLIHSVLRTGKLTPKQAQHWDRIKGIASFFSSDTEKKNFLSWHHAITSLVANHSTLFLQIQSSSEMLKKHTINLSVASYPFTNLPRK